MSENTKAAGRVHGRLMAPSSGKTIEIRLAFPTLPYFVVLNALKQKYRPRSRRGFVAAGTIVTFIVAAVGYSLILGSSGSPTDNAVAADNVRQLPKGTPDYPTLLPAGKRIEDLGGWTRVSPPDRNLVFAYVDTIGESRINVSQQPLPQEFKEDTAKQIEHLASGYKATEKVTVGKTIVYIGTSSKGPQSVIFYRDQLLVLIKSSVHLQPSQWAEYVNSLQST